MVAADDMFLELNCQRAQVVIAQDRTGYKIPQQVKFLALHFGHYAKITTNRTSPTGDCRLGIMLEQRIDLAAQFGHWRKVFFIRAYKERWPSCTYLIALHTVPDSALVGLGQLPGERYRDISCIAFDPIS